MLKPDPDAAPATCVPEDPLPNTPFAPLFFFLRAVAFESIAFSSSEGAFSGGGGAATIGLGAGAF